MKKYLSLIATLFIANIAFAQTGTNYAPPEGGGSTHCTCNAPSSSTCDADCMFSSCCICWNPNTQTGACGCYWGVATCRTEKNTSSVMNNTNFGEVHPDARITFSFQKFNLLFGFFESKSINSNLMKNVFSSVKLNYAVSDKKVPIANSDFAMILSEYSKLIDQLSTGQKEELNIYIQSLK